MKALVFVLLSTLLCACQSPSTAVQSTVIPSQQQAQDTTGNLIIFYDAQTGSAPLLKAVKISGATLVYEYKNLHGIAIRPSSKTNIEDTIAYFKKINGVLSVEQDRLLKLQ
ncbi:MAG: hypothetical protein HXM87_10100 [Neisseria sp.]|uniref:hypothetical protein n=1 Tax=Neisseria sp. TaxID=192066 RepID=UPI001CB5085C|nr:hypothetical protein [Neisseria sp.]MBF1278748.1 hypothetical protein [Neisseria sp.]MBF1282247.1 hypothetical protein [Neisseria sp.]